MSPDPASDPALARSRLASVGAVAALMIHSGRGRLAAVRTALELMQARMEGDLTDEQRASFLEQLDLFIGEYNWGAEMLRCHAGAIEAVSATGAAAEALEYVRPRAEKSGIALTLAYKEGQSPIRADRNLLRAALLNLLRNSVEALTETPPAPDTARIRVCIAEAGTRCQIDVEDNGPGVPEALRDRLFSDYVTGRPGKAGLGLSLCRDALASMGGSVSHVARADEPGARFRMELDFWRDR